MKPTHEMQFDSALQVSREYLKSWPECRQRVDCIERNISVMHINVLILQEEQISSGSE
jgi:hypothetical protein